MSQNILEIPDLVYIVAGINKATGSYPNFNNILMAVFTSRDNARKYIEYYNSTGKNLKIYTSVLNPQINERYI